MIRRFTGVLTIVGGVAAGVATGNLLLAAVCVVAGLALYAGGGRRASAMTAGAQLDMVGLVTALRANAQNRARLGSIEAALPKPLTVEVTEALCGDGTGWGGS